MGREIHRVPLDFSWPLHMQWKGYMSPYTAQKCRVCDGQGQNEGTLAIQKEYYSGDNSWYRDSRNPKYISQDELDALLASHSYSMRVFTEGLGRAPTLKEANDKLLNRSGMGLDSADDWIIIRARAISRGVYGECPWCNGEGEIWFNGHIKQLADEWWDKEKYDPPTGEGWQVWETVSEGSPISPVFATDVALIDWLVKEGYSREGATAFAKQGWVPSMVITGNVAYKDIESAKLGGE